jgi:hypothetical protein
MQVWDESPHTFRANRFFEVDFGNSESAIALTETDGAETHDKERTVAKVLTVGLALLGLTALSQTATANSCLPQHASYVHHAHRHAHYARWERPYYRASYETVYEPYWGDRYYYHRPYWTGPHYVPYSIGLSAGPFWHGGYYGGDWDDDDD